MSSAYESSYATPRRSRSWLVWLLILLLVGGGVFWMSQRGKKPPEKPAADAKPAAAPVELAPADVALVESRPLSRSLPLSGSLMPVVEATVKSKVAGELLAVAVREGDAVKKGAVLARVDTRHQQAQVDSVRASAEKARADLALAQLELDNNQRLFDKKFIAPTVLDTAKTSRAAAAAALRAAEAQARLAEIGLEDATVTAPFDGVVAKRLAQPGEKVSTDTPLLKLVDLRTLELEAAAPASEVPLISTGQHVRFTVDGFGTRAFTGRVERINPVAEEGSRSILLYFAVPNADGSLKGGMFAKGRLQLDAGEPAPLVPMSAVRSEAGLPYVLVVKDGLLVQRAVTVGLRSEEEGVAQIAEGLAVGEQVLTSSSSLLKAGQKVTVKAEAAKPAAEKPEAEKPAEPVAASPTAN